MTQGNHIWTRFAAGERPLCWHLGNARVWAMRRSQNWGIAVEYGTEELGMEFSEGSQDEVPEGLNWRFFAFDRAPEQIQLLPAHPDRPMVVRPEEPAMIPPGERVLYYVRIPTWVEISVSSENAQPVPLHRFPTRMLSDTWFGTYAEGVFSYALRFPAVRHRDELDPNAQHIVCPIRIRNQSKTMLEFAKLCLRTDFFAIYGGATHLWSNSVEIVHEGEAKPAHVKYGKRAPEYEKKLVRLCEPTAHGESLLHRWSLLGTRSSDFATS